MLRSILIGLVAGQRAMAPLAAVASAARRGVLPAGAPGARLLANPLVVSGAIALAGSEMAGDKLRSAPDRIILPGLIARSVTAAFAGAALAPMEQRKTAAVLAAATAIAASYVGFRLRVRAMRSFGQDVTGFVEDAIVMASGTAVANLNRPVQRSSR
ncbi:DUF4126 domain-containing protein [uncultured Sphingomonas sp.]|uniref:DUF4126 domain-containing protein n=1 Tax=uncultured Sphingomonas sp. TaxID=158754 RepID=UPI0025FB330D|nr:DUF4126 domain-containing protein [uncultured Sphingomonas sp.]